jgi:osmotically-inducible protein OsmY
MTPIQVCALLLLSAALGWSQQAPTPVPTPKQESRAGANDQIQSQLETLLSSDPLLNDADIETTVDDQDITLTGTVASEAQRRRVLQVASPFARWRQIVDKMTIN